MRYEDWPARMNAVVREYELSPFEWGKHDCVTFAADVALAISGRDYMSGFRGNYEDEAGAGELLAGDTLIDAINKMLGEQIPVMKAGRGDVVVAEFGGLQTAGVCIGERAAFQVNGKRLLFIPFDRCIAAWKIE